MPFKLNKCSGNICVMLAEIILIEFFWISFLPLKGKYANKWTIHSPTHTPGCHRLEMTQWGQQLSMVKDRQAECHKVLPSPLIHNNQLLPHFLTWAIFLPFCSRNHKKQSLKFLKAHIHMRAHTHTHSLTFSYTCFFFQSAQGITRLPQILEGILTHTRAHIQRAILCLESSYYLRQ